MSFLKKGLDTTPIVDTVFVVVEKAKAAKQKFGKENVIDATIGSLYREDGVILAYDSVYKYFDSIPKEVKAKYAESFRGNTAYRKDAKNWVFNGENISLYSDVIATPGGTGAVSSTIVNCLNPGETLVIPELAWGSYELMAKQNLLNVKKYSMFENEGFNLKSFKEVCSEVMKNEGHLLVIINDPCHNPTGYTMSNDEWVEVINYLNEISKDGSVVLLNDIAYIDYSYDLENSRKYMNNFNNISDNVLVIIAMSCSKTMSQYGMRLGASIILGKDENKTKDVVYVLEKNARAIWSNVSNSAMECFSYIVNDGLEEYEKEKQIYVDLLKARSDIFVKEAKENNLAIYPYKEGFFITVKMENNSIRDKYHELLMNDNIFTVKVNKGIRVAICSMSVEACKGLAKRMKDILNKVD